MRELREQQQQQQASSLIGSVSNHKANVKQETILMYGEIREVTGDEYVQAVDDADPRTCVVVHLYHHSVPDCAVLNRHLERLTRNMPQVQFLRLSSSSQGIDPIVLPDILIHLNGELKENLVCVTTEHLPPHFTESDLQFLLESFCCQDDATLACNRGTATELKTERDELFIAGTKNNPNASNFVSGSQNRYEEDEYDSDDADLDEFCKDFKLI
jgi:hypothetical protein